MDNSTTSIRYCLENTLFTIHLKDTNGVDVEASLQKQELTIIIMADKPGETNISDAEWKKYSKFKKKIVKDKYKEELKRYITLQKKDWYR